MSFCPANVIQSARSAVVEMERLYGVRVVHAAVSPNCDSHEKSAMGGSQYGFRVAFVRAPDVYLGTNSLLSNDRGFRRLDGALTGVGMMALDVRDAFAGAIRDPRMLGVAALSPWIDHFQSDVIVSNDTFSGLLGRVAGAGPITRGSLIDGLDGQIAHQKQGLDDGEPGIAALSTALARIYGMYTIKHGLLSGSISTPAALHIPDGLFPQGLGFDSLRRGVDQHEAAGLRDHLRTVEGLVSRSAAQAPHAPIGISGLASLQFGAVAPAEGPTQIAAAIDGDVANLIRSAPAASLSIQASNAAIATPQEMVGGMIGQPVVHHTVPSGSSFRGPGG